MLSDKAWKTLMYFLVYGGMCLLFLGLLLPAVLTTKKDSNDSNDSKKSLFGFFI